jgi:hypothetical protein
LKAAPELCQSWSVAGKLSKFDVVWLKALTAMDHLPFFFPSSQFPFRYLDLSHAGRDLEGHPSSQAFKLQILV